MGLLAILKFKLGCDTQAAQSIKAGGSYESDRTSSYSFHRASG
jgi:hypothetical protein